MNALSQPLIIAISSRALFNLDESNYIYETEGVNAYSTYQINNENNTLEPGVAFSLVEKLLKLKEPDTGELLAEVILISRNSAETSLRIFNSIKTHKLNITRAAFTSGNHTHPYIGAFGAHLFLSANADDVTSALHNGYAAATIFSNDNVRNSMTDQLRIAFDGDAVLFSDESEAIYQASGLLAFTQHEEDQANVLLKPGPFKPFLESLHRIQTKFSIDTCPIRTALVTARQAPAHERVIKTLRAWNIRIDESFFLGGLPKAVFLKAFNADFYFDDQQSHCQHTNTQVATGHVPYGVVNKKI